MKIVIIGGGPGGLYFALLMKKRFPGYEITVYERNRADDTFGFGVVFSDETLDNLMDYDRASPTTPSPGNSPTGTRSISISTATSCARPDTASAAPSGARCSMILQERCRELGVQLEFSTEIIDLDRFADADLIVAADGINSLIRETYKEHFQPKVELRRNHFIWLGSTRADRRRSHSISRPTSSASGTCAPTSTSRT